MTINRFHNNVILKDFARDDPSIGTQEVLPNIYSQFPCYSRNEVLSAGEDGCVLQTDMRTDKSTTIVEQDKALYSIDTDYDNYILLSGVSWSRSALIE